MSSLPFTTARQVTRAIIAFSMLAASACTDRGPTGTDNPAVPRAVVSARGGATTSVALLDDALARILPALSPTTADALRGPIERLRTDSNAASRAADIAVLRRAIARGTEGDAADLAALDLMLDEISRPS